MTKNLTVTKFPMELALDSFLNSTSESDDDCDDSPSNSVPHRTLDEILNCSDSSSSPSPPSSPKSHQQQNRLLDLRDSNSQNDAAESPRPARSQSLNYNPEPSRSNSVVRVKSGGFSGDPIWRPPSASSSASSSRQLPSLFGGVRSKAKPGAALAAAAAASRSVPTPHAAAIKSRRAATLQKVVDAGDSGSNVGGDDHDVVSSSSEKTKSGDVSLDDVDSLCNFQSTNIEDRSLVNDLSKNVGVEVGPVPGDLSSTTTTITTTASFGSAANMNLNLEENVATVLLDKNADNNNLDVNDSIEMDGPSSSGIDGEGMVVEDSVMSALEEVSKFEDRDPSSTAGVGGGDDQDDVSSLSGISELVEERMGQLESERINKRAEKKLKPPTMKPLELAEEREKKQAFTGLNWVEGAAAQPMRLEGVRRGSTSLGYFDVDSNNFVTRTIASQTFRRDHGSPQVLAVHVNYIAVGMTKGVIVVVPSRYSSHSIDNLDAAKMLMLGLQGDRSYAPVTSMCFNQPGDLLLAGYGDGHITVWDLQRASAAKIITGEHNAPVVHALFLGQDSQVTRQFKAVTGDSKGLVLLHSFSVVPLINRFNIKTQCLLDGQRTGTVLSASPLMLEESGGGSFSSSQGNTSISSNSIGSMVGGVVGGEAGWKLFNEGSSLVDEGVVVFATHQTALVVRLSPTLQIYAQLSRPDGVREGSVPYTAWKCTSHSHGSSAENTFADPAERVSLLAVAWDRKVQVAKLVKSELKVYGKWSLDSTAIGVAWLDSHLLVVLTIMGQLFLFAKDGTVIHQTSFTVDGSGGDDLVAYHTHFKNIFGNPEKAYHNGIAVRGASIYVLGPVHLIVSRLLPWEERIQVLQRAGDWMGALNMAMTLYDGQAHGGVDLPRSVDAVQEIIMPYLVKLLLSYVDEVFSYISVAFCNQMGKVEQQQDNAKTGSSSVHSEIKEQFTRVGGVAVEFCVHIQRTDILFEEIFSKFLAVQQKDTFLELLEPYILRDMLGSLPPEIMQALVEHYSGKGWLQRVEQCVLHMDISSLDFNQVVRLCREHGLYGALIYLFNKGLDDFRAPLEELLVVSRNSQRESANALGYRMLVYLKYCFSGLAFPPGHGGLPPARLSSLRAELVQFLLENLDAQNLQAVPSWGGTYLNLYHFLELDTEATLEVLRCAFVDDGTIKPDFSTHDHAYASMEFTLEKRMMVESQNELVQSTIDALVQIIEKARFSAEEFDTSDKNESGVAWPLKRDIGLLFEFISYHIASRKAHISKSMLSQILEFLTSEIDFPPNIASQNAKSPKLREKQLLALLETVPETEWDVSHVLQLCEKACFHQVCGLIHEARHQYLTALDCYMRDIDEPIHTFSYINKTIEQLNDIDAFRSAVLSRIPELVILSRECTFFLVISHFNNESAHILSQLHSQPRSLFLYLKTVIEVHLSGTLDFSPLIKDDNDGMYGKVKDQSQGLDAYLERISDFPKFVRNNSVPVTDDMIELYLELLCQYERDSVLKFLETFDSYRVEHCLRLCQEYGIIDAAAFLLERVGDVGSALLLTLSALDDRFAALEIAVGSLALKKPSSRSANVEHYNNVMKMKEVQDIKTIIHACISLCQRNTPRLVPEESETLWFRLLDSFCGPLMDSFSDKRVLRQENHVGMLAENFGSHEADEACVIKWKISKGHKGAHILRKLFSQFIKEIVEGMIGHVRLPTIMSKLLSDNGSQEFGDFKITILGMLGTYGFERRILDTAKSLIEDDTFYTMSLLKKGVSHGYAPRSLACCICNCLLPRNSPSFSIRIFNCGHATHLQCELENEPSSRGTLSGCPICAPKKNSQKSRNKSALPENGLVNKVLARTQRAQGTSGLHLHDDASESYGLDQISRFDMLINLEKDQKLVQVESMPQLKLAPPAVYHERIKKGPDLLTGESSTLAKLEKPIKFRQHKELKMKGSSLRFPLKSSIFGKEKTGKR